jgi:hypothetical protein
VGGWEEDFWGEHFPFPGSLKLFERKNSLLTQHVTVEVGSDSGMLA